MLSPFSLSEDKWQDSVKYLVPKTVKFQSHLPVPPFLHFLLAKFLAWPLQFPYHLAPALVLRPHGHRGTESA